MQGKERKEKKPKRDLEKELLEKKEKSEEYLTRLKYLQAEFDNYRKFSEKEKREFEKFANEGLVKDLLSYLDEFEEAINSLQEGKLKGGFIILQSNLLKTLQKHGLEKIEAAGKKLDPYLHEVILAQESDKEEGIILQELQKGYRLNGKVLRHSKVVVSKPKDKSDMSQKEVK